MSTNKDLDSRAEACEYLLDRTSCGKDCKYADFCPELATGMARQDCIIRASIKTKFDSWYALYLGGYDGLKSELTGVAYRLKQQARTPDDELQYFTAITKILQSCYAPEKTSRDDEITQVIFSTPIIGGTTLPNESEEGKEEDLKE